MNRLMAGITTFIIALGLTLSATAQSKTTTPIRVGTPQNSTPNPNGAALHKLHVRQFQIRRQIEMNFVAKKITKTEAMDLEGKIKAERVQESQWLKGSGNRTLTGDQIQQLNLQLDSISSGL